MKLKTIAIAVLMVCGVNTVSAQVEEGLRFGATAGLNTSTTDADGSKSKLGFHVGARAEYSFSESLYATASLLYSHKGFKMEGNDDYKANAGYIELPVMAGYRWNLNNGLIIFGETGPYFAYGICGKHKFGHGIGDEDFFGKKEEGGAQRFDAGWGINAGVEYSQFQIRVGYELGFTKLWDVDGSAKNRNLTVGVAYMF